MLFIVINIAATFIYCLMGWCQNTKAKNLICPLRQCSRIYDFLIKYNKHKTFSHPEPSIMSQRPQFPLQLISVAKALKAKRCLSLGCNELK